MKGGTFLERLDGKVTRSFGYKKGGKEVRVMWNGKTFRLTSDWFRFRKNVGLMLFFLLFLVPPQGLCLCYDSN